MNVTNIPAPRVPLLDPRSGMMSREWYMFFLNLFNITGGGASATTIPELEARQRNINNAIGVISLQGEPGEDGISIPGPQGRQGPPGLTIPGMDGEDAEPFGLFYPPGLVAEVNPWTPSLTFATPGDLSVTYSVQVGYSVKLGPLVFNWFNIETSAFTHTTASGALRITGDPITLLALTNATWHGAGRINGVTKAGYTNFSARRTTGGAFFTIIASGSGVASANIAAADMPTGGAVILQFTTIYQAG